MNGFDLSTVSGIYKGGSEISALYLGDTLIYPTNYEEEYFTICSLDSNNDVYFHYEAQYTSPNASPLDETFTIEVSRDKKTWRTFSLQTNNGSSSYVNIETLGRGNKLYVRSNTQSFYRYDTDNNRCWAYIVCAKKYKLQGNIMSLIAGDNFINATTLSANAFRNMYGQYTVYSTNLVDIQNLIMPATTLGESCYENMFSNCSYLITPPVLPATTLAKNCYKNMFAYCWRMTTTPVLPATTLTEGCYSYMFNGCNSLTTAPELPATTLANSCYRGMFSGCTNLTSIPTLSATTLADYCYYGMFSGCTSLTTVPALLSTTLADYCYSYMFSGCTALTTIPTLSATTLADYCYSYMFNKCTSLVTAPSISATTLADNCCDHMFSECTALTTVPTLSATTLDNYCYSYMFNGCASLTTAPSISATTLTDYCCYHMFDGCTSLTTIPTLSATTLADCCYRSMFYGCTRLTTAPSISATTLADYCYSYMFYGCTRLTTAPELSATTLANYCYDHMFSGCTRLTTAPELSATTLALGCYSWMFYNCTSLATAPELPATTLQPRCYQQMFYNCTSLTTSPMLLADTLVDYCYSDMFRGCTSLNFITCLASDISASYCTAGWVRDVAYRGTFVKYDSNVSWTSGWDGIPQYWNEGYAVLINQSTGGTIISNKTYARYYDTVTLDVTTDPGYELDTLSVVDVSGNPVTVTNNQFTMNRSSVIVSATYNYAIYSVSISQAQNGTVTSDKQTAYFGETVTLTVTPNTGYSLDTLTVVDTNSNPITVTNNQFTMPSSNVTVSAIFTYISYTVSIGQITNGTVTSDKQTAYPNETVTLTATPDQGYSLKRLTVLDANNNPITVTNNQFIMPISNVTVSALFVNFENMYLTFQSLANNNVFAWNAVTSDAAISANNIQYSTDLTNWTTVTPSTSGATITTLNINDEIYIKGNYSGNSSTYCYFTATKNFNVSGNIMSLSNGDNFTNATSVNNYQFNNLFYYAGYMKDASNLMLPATTLGDYCYHGMFYYCMGLVTPPNTLPATTLAMYCYQSMFYGCSSLTSTPTLPATTLSYRCYYRMFYGCTSLTSTPTLSATTIDEGCYMEMFATCTSLTSTSTLPATTMEQECYSNMFSGCTSLTTAPALPATTLAKRCYDYMFSGCTSLTTAPALSATTLAESCYAYMFSGCTSLVTAPALPATTLDKSCYREMFRDCTSLVTAPVLPATTLTQNCYSYMFYGCTSLNSITMLATNISASGCLTNWVYNVAATGTFTKTTSMTTLPTGNNGIPTGWTVVNLHDYPNEYLTIESQANNNTISWKSSNASYTQNIQYSTDLTNWTTVTSTSAGATLATLNNGDKLYLKGSLVGHNSANYYEYFTSSGNFKVYGNIMSLTNGDNFASATSLTQNYQLASLFRSSKVTDITNLIMPATTLKKYCYQNMFNGCKQLTTAATKLPATSVDYYSYANMFQGCTSLVTPPVLCGITLGGYAYQSMFNGCTSLTTLPRLADGTTITSWAPYRQMFSGCTGITDARYDVNGDRLLPTHLTVSSGGSAFERMFESCTNLQYAPELTDMTPHHGEYNQMFKGCTSLYSIITHADSLGTANFGAIVENTGHVGTVYKAKDVTWDTSQYSQFNYTSGSAWTVTDGNYNAGDYQT